MNIQISHEMPKKNPPTPIQRAQSGIGTAAQENHAGFQIQATVDPNVIQPGHEFRRHPWTNGMEPGAVTRLMVSVNAPQTTHELSVRQLEKWVSRTAGSPKDTVLKGRITELLRTNGGG